MALFVFGDLFSGVFFFFLEFCSLELAWDTPRGMRDEEYTIRLVARR